MNLVFDFSNQNISVRSSLHEQKTINSIVIVWLLYIWYFPFLFLSSVLLTDVDDT